jgi:hypothetical protein
MTVHWALVAFAVPFSWFSGFWFGRLAEAYKWQGKAHSSRVAGPRMLSGGHFYRVHFDD